jgi:hypothetical protein
VIVFVDFRTHGVHARNDTHDIPRE